MATKTKTNAPLYLLVRASLDNGFFHLRARVVTQRYDIGNGTNGSWKPYGCDDDYGDGLRLTGLEMRCQGDSDSRTRKEQPVYGFSAEYHDVYSVDLRQSKRMTKTLERIERRLNTLADQRGYVKTYGEYLGRIAEVFGCGGMVFEKDRTGLDAYDTYEWMSVGDGVNRANHKIFMWMQEGVQQAEQTA